MVRERAAQVIRAWLLETARDDPEHGERRRREQPDKTLRAELEEPRPEHGESDSERDRTTTVGAEPVVRHHDEAEHAEEDETHDPEAPSREEGAREERPGFYLIHTRRPIELLAELTDWARQRDVLLNDLRVGHESLEEVFLRLTGHELRE